jgi:hypothetical protein
MLPSSSNLEPELVIILDFFGCLIERVHDSILQGKINAFDQQLINSFLCSGSCSCKATDLPLAHKPQEGTCRKYKKPWKQLLCLQFCITLLDHRLMGDIFDSVIMGFLVVLGINTTR